MNAVVLREHGGPDVLRAEGIPTPEPGPGEVRVRVRAVALNHLDIWVRRGGPAFKLEYPAPARLRHRRRGRRGRPRGGAAVGTEGRRAAGAVVHEVRGVPRRP